MAKVIAISGASGCGKTTLVKALALHFSCPALHFDDFDPVYPRDMQQWLYRGADVSEIVTPGFEQAILKLQKASDAPFIFIEEPFGRNRKVMAPLVDFVALLDLPLELCLSRILQRNMVLSQQVDCSSLLSFLIKYDSFLRDVYREAVQQVRVNCDLQLQHSSPLDGIVNELSAINNL